MTRISQIAKMIGQSMRQEVPSNVYEEIIHSRIMMMLALNLNISMIAFRKFAGESIEDSFAYSSAMVAMKMMERLKIDISYLEEANLTNSRFSTQDVKIEKDSDFKLGNLKVENPQKDQAEIDDQMSSLNIKEEYRKSIDNGLRMSLSIRNEKDFISLEQEIDNSDNSESLKSYNFSFQFPISKRLQKRNKTKKISKQQLRNIADARINFRDNFSDSFSRQNRFGNIFTKETSDPEEFAVERSHFQMPNFDHSKMHIKNNKKSFVALKPTGLNLKRKTKIFSPKMSSLSFRSYKQALH